MDFLEGVGRRQSLAQLEHEYLELQRKSLNGNENNVLFKNRGGATPDFVAAGYVSGVDRIEDSRGVGVSDIDADGDLDLIVQTVEGPSLLLVNQGPTGNWLQVRARGTYSNRDAIGARIDVRIGERWLVREVSSTSGYISGQPLLCHFGLGAAQRVDELVVRWPRGGETRLFDVAADQRLEIVEPEGGADGPKGPIAGR